MKKPHLALSTIWLVVPTVLVLLSVWTSNEFPLDFWLHVNSGRWMCETGQLIQTDTFTHTIAGQAVLNQPWLTQLSMYQLYRAGGYELNQLVAGVCYATAFGLITLLTYRRTRSARTSAAVMLIALAVAITNLAVRPQAISVLLFAVELYILWVFPTRRLAPLAVAVVELVWSNTHGAFPLGIVLPGIFLVARLADALVSGSWREAWRDPLVRSYFLCCTLAVGAMFVNPQGLMAIRYVTGVTSKATQREIEEWLPTSMETAAGAAFLASVVFSLIVLGLSRRPPAVVDWLLLIPFLVLAAKSQRMVIWWALILPPVIAPPLNRVLVGATDRWRRVLARRKAARPAASSAGTWHESRDREITGARIHRTGNPRSPAAARDMAFFNWIILGAFVCLLATSTPWTRQWNMLLPAEKRATVPDDEPLRAVAFLAASEYRGRMYQPMEWGSYVSWQLDPRVKVFVDSRVDFFPDSVWRDYVTIGRQPDRAVAVLGKYDVDLVLWNRRLPSSLPSALEASPSWQRVYRDHNSVIFVHRAGDTRLDDQLAEHGRNAAGSATRDRRRFGHR